MTTPATRLAELFGSKRELARIVSRHPSLISKWMAEGRIPPAHNQAIKIAISELAPERGEEWARLALGCLDSDVCPGCGRPLP